MRHTGQLLDGADRPEIGPPPVDDVSQADQAQLAGSWMVEGESVRIEHTGDHLSMMHNGIAYRMVQVQRRMFYIPGLDDMVGFARNPSGSFTKMYLSSNVGERWAAR